STIGRARVTGTSAVMPVQTARTRRTHPSLTYSYIDIYIRTRARAPTPADTCNAVAEPRRRAILDVLAQGERSVNDLVAELGLAQPQVSKHLNVLREVGAVDVREDGRRRLYRINGEALKPIHDWVVGFEQLWSERFDRLDDVLEDLKREEQGDVTGDEREPREGHDTAGHADTARAH